MPGTSQAFTRIELMAVLAALAALGALALPLFAATRADSDQAGCFNNLRQIHRGTMSWANDHGDRTPWRTPVAEGGTFTNSLRSSAAWFEFLSFSNQLPSPRLLACPADEGVKVASAWLDGPGALTRTGYRQNCVSYTIGLHVSFDLPRSLLCGDRNVRTSRILDCGAAFVQSSYSLDGNDPALTWTNAVHGLSGHIMTIDGGVNFTGRSGWRDSLFAPGSGNGIDGGGIGGAGPVVHTLRDR